MSRNSGTRVLFVCASGGKGRLQLGGAERFLMEMVPALSARISVGAIVSDLRVAEVLQEHGVWVRVARPKSRFDRKYLNAIQAGVDEFRPTVVSAHLLSAVMHTRVISLRNRQFRMISTLHNSMRQYVSAASGCEMFRATLNLVLERFARAVAKSDSVAVSGFEYEELKKTFHRGRVWHIDNSLPASWSSGPIEYEKQDIRHQLGLPEDRKLLLYVGRLELEKGADRLAGIAACLPGDWTLVVVGDGEIQVRGRNVVSVGRRDDPRPYYLAADVVIIPSRVESFGRVAVEAASMGKPVVHTGVGGLAEVLAPVEGRLAWTLDSDQNDDAAALVCSSYKAVEESPKTAAQAAEDERARYSFDRMLQGWIRVLLNVDCKAASRARFNAESA